MYETICMKLYLADRFLENRGVWDNMYETIYTTDLGLSLKFAHYATSQHKLFLHADHEKKLYKKRVIDIFRP